MKKENILKKNLEFQEVIKEKRQIINKYLIIYFSDWNSFQIGISIPKKFANAVKRNFIKRQIKWILDSFINYKIINLKIVLIVRKDFLNLTINQKKEQIINIFSKLKI